ncbi:endonuclease MutS2 [Cohnella sp. JJ-181]|uniref:endonuclease MutS2 n=1 Tax=Cohnella rhizoplanae TaxID=2974897 RepID=UPI0022FFA65A|nr:DNA mismatch repair protein MutS [Cohnella sp. JJ-181]CAI6017215.1 Endonuclease MutS2 [Cohnella sp. JJ-181]
MRSSSLDKLEYARAIEAVVSRTSTYMGRRLAERLAPLHDARVIAARLAETEETRTMIDKGMHVPLPSMEGMEDLFALLGTGYVPSEQQFGMLAQFVRSCGQLRRFMASKAAAAPTVAAYASSMHELDGLLAEIEGCIDRGRILDGASQELGRIRRKLRQAEEKLQKRLDGLLSKHAEHLQDRIVSTRGGRYVLSVKKEHRRKVSGTVLDESASGQTVFVEPSETAGLQMELSALRAEEQREELQVLARLTGEAELALPQLSVNAESVAHYDFLLAKAKWALAIGALPPELTDDGTFELRKARHPFLSAKPVPLDIAMDAGYRSLLITGPNTGGKTVALKTVGLLTLMAQTGLLIPAAAGSRVGVFRAIEADIGDGQSLDRSLSTFSSHIRNVTDILAVADRSTLVLLDELATGTDPGEGVGLSIAVLEELYRRGAAVLATTHFNEIKEYARLAPGFRNARMAFDEDTLQPLYRLDMGEAGDSYAFVIARKFGIGEEIIARAKEIARGLKGGAGRGVSAEAQREGVESSSGCGEAQREGVERSSGSGEALRDGVERSGGSGEALREGVERSGGSGEALREGVERSSGSGHSLREAVKGILPAERIEAGASNAAGEVTAARKGKGPGAGEAGRERKELAAGANGERQEPAAVQPELGVGDVVWIPSLGQRGVIYRLADERGNLIVQIRGAKQLINHKRVKLQIESKHLYPEDYDMDIVFDTVDNRKKRSLMAKRHVEGLKIEREDLE